jgi:hypothetical protein
MPRNRTPQHLPPKCVHCDKVAADPHYVSEPKPDCEDRRFLFMGEGGWGTGGKSIMRLQMHATDPAFLEKRLGERASNGCIRISATLNRFIDRYGLIDADYEQVAQHGRLLWVLRGDRTPVATPGRYLMVVDTQRAALPAWARRP